MNRKGIALLQSVGATALAAIISSVLSSGNMQQYESLYKPPLAPPGWLFPIVWTILYVLMAIAAYLIAVSVDDDKESALTAFWLQLVFNALWPVIFFKFQAYGVAFLWLVVLWLLIKKTIERFSAIDELAGKLLVPYLIWVTFAGYLNLAYALKL